MNQNLITILRLLYNKFFKKIKLITTNLNVIYIKTIYTFISIFYSRIKSMHKKILWLDYVRAIACCMVVLLHTAAEYVLKSEGVNWNFANLVDSFTRVCVPLFFMISGYLFFSEKSVKIKNFIKIITALLFYSTIAFFAAITFHIIQPNIPIDFKILSQPSFYHLWYFYPLIAIYLLSAIIQIRNIKFITSLTIFIIFFILFNPKINNYTQLFNFRIDNYFYIQGDFLFFVLYGLLGASFRNFQPKKTLPYLYLTTYILCSLFIAYLTYLTSHNKTWPFYSYSTPLVFLAAFSLFSFIKTKELELKENSFITIISKNSLGIYGIHAFILYAISYFTHFYKYSVFIFLPIIFLVVLTSSLIFSLILKKIDKKGYIT